MMTPAQQDAARALAKHPRFVPQRGMTGVRDAPGKPDNLRPELVVWGKGSEDDFRAFGCIPDLADPATVGSIAGLARSLDSEAVLTCQHDGCGWFVDAYAEPPGYPTEGEAWAALILRLPCHK